MKKSSSSKRGEHKRGYVRSHDAVSINAGDIEVFHPVCRRRILVTQMGVRRNKKDGSLFLFVEGICYACDRVVRLKMTDSGLDDFVAQ